MMARKMDAVPLLRVAKLVKERSFPGMAELEAGARGHEQM
jgi:hypothetical protein